MRRDTRQLIAALIASAVVTAAWIAGSWWWAGREAASRAILEPVVEEPDPVSAPGVAVVDPIHWRVDLWRPLRPAPPSPPPAPPPPPALQATLLGISDDGERVTALIDTPDGGVRRMEPGGTPGAWRIERIDAAGVMLSSGEHEQRLELNP